MNQKIKSFLGTGWSFPPTFNKFSMTVNLSSDVDDIEESIRIILGTFPGERIMQPKFGCYLKRLSFEIIDESLLIRINEEIRKALLNFEPRVTFNEAEIDGVDDMNGLILVRINYTVIITNTRYNIVYPFYINEGTLIREQ
ncbi:MAG TPA: GPW/gp25 family protein [Ferruginibacter sp.]|nr:GPW/gp25 family protein [Ferruginibacter sp.]